MYVEIIIIIIIIIISSSSSSSSSSSISCSVRFISSNSSKFVVIMSEI
jgi:hypothetical protein